MKEKQGIRIPPYVMLMMVSVIMSFAIAGVYALTKDRIDAAALAEQQAARSAVMDGAADMTEVLLPEDAPVDYVYEVYDGAGDLMGLISQITVVGFGGEIEVTVGMDTSAVITAIEVGGANFSETSGLGAKTREPAFKDQFAGMSGMLVLKQNIDSVTGASISSGAVVSGVNKAVEYMKTLLPEGTLSADTEELPLSAEEVAVLLPGAQETVWMGGGSGITGWWQADNGYIVRAMSFGEGPIAVTMGFDANGVVTGVIIGDENFMETEGRGDKILEDWYKLQFVGKSGAQTYGDGIDAISGATVTSDAALAAINACMTFDPAQPGAAVQTPVAADASGESAVADAQTAATVLDEPDPTPTPDAVTAASVTEEEDSVSEPAIVGAVYTPVPTETPVPVEATEPEKTIVIPPWNPVVPQIVPSASRAETEPDAVTAATGVAEPTPMPTPTPTPDAVTAASVVEETTPTPAPTPTPTPDAVTAASVVEATPTPSPTPDAVTQASIPEE